MTLLITVFAAVISTAIWYKNAANDNMCLSVPCYLYWGASIMWLCDAVFEYIEMGAEYFNPSVADLINDSILGFSAVAFGLIIWVGFLLIKDPKKVIRRKLTSK